jgi:tRNA(adenine34) deaminase
MKPLSDEYFMKKAIDEAHKARDKDEIPVGAIIVYENRIIAKGHNLTEKLTDFTAHAEMQVFTSASEFLNNKYLNKCTLYVTLEPCVMCAGAAFWTRIGRLVIGASDERRGYDRISKSLLHSKTKVSKGVLKESCSKIMSDFFKTKR